MKRKSDQKKSLQEHVIERKRKKEERKINYRNKRLINQLKKVNKTINWKINVDNENK